MLEILRTWLNGDRIYKSGILIFNIICKEQSLLKTVLNRGNTADNQLRLEKELLQHFNFLKNCGQKPNETDSSKKGFKKDQSQKNPAKKSDTITKTAIQSSEIPCIPNIALWEACKLQANNKYKEAMNKRAVLFSMLPSELYSDPNTPDLVKQRSPLAIEVVELYNEASLLYDRADFVEKHGVLPDQENSAEDKPIPDHLVKSTLDNLRKNLNKIKVKEQTPERIILLQKHTEKIKYLEERWHSLK